MRVLMENPISMGNFSGNHVLSAEGSLFHRGSQPRAVSGHKGGEIVNNYHLGVIFGTHWWFHWGWCIVEFTRVYHINYPFFQAKETLQLVGNLLKMAGDPTAWMSAMEAILCCIPTSLQTNYCSCQNDAIDIYICNYLSSCHCLYYIK